MQALHLSTSCSLADLHVSLCYEVLRHKLTICCCRCLFRSKREVVSTILIVLCFVRSVVVVLPAYETFLSSHSFPFSFVFFSHSKRRRPVVWIQMREVGRGEESLSGTLKSWRRATFASISTNIKGIRPSSSLRRPKSTERNKALKRIRRFV